MRQFRQDGLGVWSVTMEEGGRRPLWVLLTNCSSCLTLAARTLGSPARDVLYAMLTVDIVLAELQVGVGRWRVRGVPSMYHEWVGAAGWSRIGPGGASCSMVGSSLW